MTTSITDGSTTIYPIIDGYTAARPNRNVVHPILGSTAPAVSLRQAGLRTGTLRLVFSSDSTAFQAHALLSSGVELTLASTERASINMSFVLAGAATIDLDSKTSVAWVVTFDYQETD